MGRIVKRAAHGLAAPPASGYRGRCMLDRLYLPLLGLATIAAIALSLVWPQGLGARSPGPFGHTPVQQTPAMKAAMDRETAASQARIQRAREAVRNLQSRALSETR